MVRVLYFAWVREAVGADEETVSPPPEVATVADLIDWLSGRSDGHARAFAMFALGQPMGAQEALATGIATSVVDPDQLDHEARRLAAELLARPARSLAATKALMRDVPALLEHTRREIEVFADRLRSPESAEALAAFREKRRPDFAQFD